MITTYNLELSAAEVEGFERSVIKIASAILNRKHIIASTAEAIYLAEKSALRLSFERTFPTYDHSKCADGTYISLRTGEAYQLFEAGFYANV